MAIDKPDPPDYLFDEEVHRILRDALAEAQVEHHGAPPFHLGGPRPRLTARALATVAFWCADRARPYVSARYAAEYDEVVASARGLLASQQIQRGELNRVLEIANRGRGRKNPYPIAPITAGAAYNAHIGFGDRVGDSARAAARRLVRTLYLADETSLVRPCLESLDQQLMIGEAQIAVERYAPKPTPRIGEVLLRLDRGNKTAGHFIFTIRGSDDVGAVVKLGSRYRFIRGSRESVMASLPEGIFDSGVDALLG